MPPDAPWEGLKTKDLREGGHEGGGEEGRHIHKFGFLKAWPCRASNPEHATLANSHDLSFVNYNQSHCSDPQNLFLELPKCDTEQPTAIAYKYKQPNATDS
jgi:hypothetical protein